jgi:hypothetical protein
VKIIYRSVQWIDNPQVVAIAPQISTFFGQNAMSGKPVSNHRHNGVLTGTVDGHFEVFGVD